MKWFWWVLTILLLLAVFVSRDFSSRYEQPIQGDAKGYYAYLPAVFIYQDAEYSFVDEMEAKYYPKDFSHAKDFRVKQKNGKYVNKCFPGLSLLYLPFFALSAMISFVFGFPVDGYSAPFQMGISFAHIFYYVFGLIQLSKVLGHFRVSKWNQIIIFFLFTFGTNLWFYLIHDHSVAHVFIFFLVCVFIRIFFNWLEYRLLKQIGWMGIVLALLVVIRPTNLLIILFIPFLLIVKGESWKALLDFKKGLNINILPYLQVCLLIVVIPSLLWKWQSDLWLVYSYGDEGFNFSNPQFWNYLFSIQKGWLFWTPLILLLILIFIVKYRRNVKYVLSLLLPFLILVYVFSSWWCWTFGAGMGQRSVIDYYPFLILAFGIMFVQMRKQRFVFLIATPFLILNLVQAFQFRESILIGGQTSKDDYWKHFVQIKKDVPTVEASKEWKLLRTIEHKEIQNLNEANHFTNVVLIPIDKDSSKVVMEIDVSGKHKSTNFTLVLTNSDGSYYQNFYLGDVVYRESRVLQYLFEVPNVGTYRTYIWNGDSSDELQFSYLKVKIFKSRD
jgi:hypothetical protein